jgi:hypothetical protein
VFVVGLFIFKFVHIVLKLNLQKDTKFNLIIYGSCPLQTNPPTTVNTLLLENRKISLVLEHLFSELPSIYLSPDNEPVSNYMHKECTKSLVWYNNSTDSP